MKRSEAFPGTQSNLDNSAGCACTDDSPVFCATARFTGTVEFNMAGGEESYPVAAPLSCYCSCHVSSFYIREHLAQQITARHFQHKRTASRAEITNRLSARVDREDILY